MLSKTYFTEEYLNFFMELASNNHKDWFDTNKKRYQNIVKTPFETLIQDIIEKQKKPLSLGELSTSECIFRINKDVRFSKDKTPYKIQMSALIAKGGKKNMYDPGLYIEIGPEFINIYTGFYMPEKEQLHTLRSKVAANPKKLEAILNKKDFINAFGEVKGEKSKVLPVDIKALAKAHPLVYNKQFYLLHQADATLILNPGLLEYINRIFGISADFNRFLSNS